jgi:hypothetical protein
MRPQIETTNPLQPSRALLPPSTLAQTPMPSKTIQLRLEVNRSIRFPPRAFLLQMVRLQQEIKPQTRHLMASAMEHLHSMDSVHPLNPLAGLVIQGRPPLHSATRQRSLGSLHQIQPLADLVHKLLEAPKPLHQCRLISVGQLPRPLEDLVLRVNLVQPSMAQQHQAALCSQRLGRLILDLMLRLLQGSVPLINLLLFLAALQLHLAVLTMAKH